MSPQSPPNRSENDEPTWLRPLLKGLFAIEDVTVGAMGGRAIRVRGRFLIDAAEIHERLAPFFRDKGGTVLLRREKGQDIIFFVRGLAEPAPNNRWLPVVLAVITVLSMLFTQALPYYLPELSLAGLVDGLRATWWFTPSLLAILAAHEFAHYFTARHFGVAVTPPYLIPFPLSPFGTMGALIRMKSVPANRREMLFIGAAGPLAGVLVAIPILFVGLSLSTVSPLPTQGGYTMEGNSLLYLAIKFLAFGRLLPSGGEDVFLHPVAYAGWAGLLVTSFNLVPAAQLDGGHIASALLGDKSRYLNWIVIGGLLVLGMQWPGWFLWAGLIFFVSRVEVPPLNDVTPLRPAEIAVAVLLLTLFVLTFTPLPLRSVA
ncbi:MAG: hypothetical protein A2Y73_02900 [Chloroflexi bacterium RBG_13_56_8]|nr:MAG: hypothetical protein A2Y73_02900 [Chloroflexi bacterium RBG_13_56_8]